MLYISGTQGNSKIMVLLTVIKTGGTIPSLRARRGDFEDWILGGMGLANGRAVVVDVAAGQPLPQAGSVGPVVVTGSHDMVTDRLGWSERTACWLAEVVASGAPVLGICYGHQLLAYALGGTVDYNPNGREAGTTEVRLLAAAQADLLLAGLPSPMEVHVSHSQSVLRLPPGAIRLAENAWDANQAYRVGACAWGVQFHPEFDAEVMRAYAAEDHLPPECRIQDTSFGSRILRRFASLVLGQSFSKEGM
jgi:GMP synthase (glutamine-hydrolysing)